MHSTLFIPGAAQAMSKPHIVVADWDAEAGVWVATSDDVPGLATESATLEQLLAKLKYLVPELLMDNKRTRGAQPAEFQLLARH